jgi:hypothetical protein
LQMDNESSLKNPSSMLASPQRKQSISDLSNFNKEIYRSKIDRDYPRTEINTDNSILKSEYHTSNQSLN